MKKILLSVIILCSILTLNSCKKDKVEIEYDLLTKYSWKRVVIIRNNFGSYSMCLPMHFQSNGVLKYCLGGEGKWELINNRRTILMEYSEWDIIDIDEERLHVETYYYNNEDIRTLGTELMLYNKSDIISSSDDD